jgi:hypothetical protein
VSKQEGELKAERQKRAWKGRAIRGDWHTGKWTFGYDIKGNVIAEQAAFIQKTYQDLLAGRSLRSAFLKANELGFTTVKGKKWVTKTFKEALLNPTIAGISVYNGEPVGVGQWQAIVSPDEQETLRKRLTDKSRRPEVDLTRKHLLSHLMVCACGGKVRADQIGPDKKAKRSASRKVYKCYECGRSISEEIADRKVEIWVGWFLASGANYAKLQPLMSDGDTVRLEEIQKELDSITDDEKALADSGVSLNMKLQLGTELQEKRSALQSEYDRLSRHDGMTALLRTITEPKQVLPGVKAWSVETDWRQVRQNFQNLSLEDKRRVLRTLATITMKPATKAGRATEAQVMERIEINPLF